MPIFKFALGVRQSAIRQLSHACLFLIFVLGLAQSLRAQDLAWQAKGVDLRETQLTFGQAFERARMVEPRHKASVLKLSSQMQDLEIVKSRLRPKISLSVAKSWVNLMRQDATSIQVNQGYLSNSEVLSLRQPIYAPMLTADESQQIALFRSYEQGIFQEQLALFFRMVDVSLEYASALQELQLVNQQIALINQRWIGAGQRFTSGQGTKTEISEVKVELERLKAQIPMLQLRIASSQLDFSVMTGGKIQWSQINWADITPSQLFNLPSPEKALSQLADAHPDILAKRFELESSKWALESVTARHKPSLDLAGQVSRTLSESAFFIDSRARTQSLGVQLNWSFYEGGGIVAAQRQAVINVELAQSRLEESHARVITDYQKAQAQYASGLEKINAYERTLNAAQETSLANQRSYQTGFRSMIDLLQSEGRALQASSDLMRARIEWLQAWLKAKAMLSGDVNDLVQLIALCNSKIFTR